MSTVSHWFRSLKLRWIRVWHYLNGYVKICYEFQPDEEDTILASETLWSKSLGNNLYQVENIPVFIEDLNLHDIVKCESKSNELPVIIEIIRRSKNRTLRVEFREEISAESAVDIIWSLREKQIFYEKAGARRYMFNVEPSMDYENVRDFLKEKEEEGLLRVYE